MALLSILQEPNKILRKRAAEIPPEEIKSKSIQRLLKDMSGTLRSVEVGVGLAAPQIGKSLRIFLISEEALASDLRGKNVTEEEVQKSKSEKNWRHLVFINPKILKVSHKKPVLTEGCLSVSDPKGAVIFGRIRRPEKISIEAYDETGKKFQRGASGLFAQVIQHESDHLDGVLFIDKAIEVKRIEPDERNDA